MSPERRARSRQWCESKSATKDEIKDLAERLGLIDFLGRNVLELSIGQQQRVAAARALIGSPALVVADEPTSALDEDRQNDFVELLLERAEERGASVLFVSHNQNLSKHFERRVSLEAINQVRERHAS